jgi:hypothetical protein
MPKRSKGERRAIRNIVVTVQRGHDQWTTVPAIGTLFASIRASIAAWWRR